MNSFQTMKIDIAVQSFEEVISARQKVRLMMEEMGFPLLAQTRIVTAVSELARNMVIHAQNGRMLAHEARSGMKKGITCEFRDEGPGIENIEMSMRDGYSSTNSLGLGLSGAKRLCGEFNIKSKVGVGTTVTISEWL